MNNVTTRVKELSLDEKLDLIIACQKEQLVRDEERSDQYEKISEVLSDILERIRDLDLTAGGFSIEDD